MIQFIKSLFGKRQSVDSVLKGILSAVKKLEEVAEANVQFADNARNEAAKAQALAEKYHAESVRAEKVVENLRKLLEAQS